MIDVCLYSNKLVVYTIDSVIYTIDEISLYTTDTIEQTYMDTINIPSDEDGRYMSMINTSRYVLVVYEHMVYRFDGADIERIVDKGSVIHGVCNMYDDVVCVSTTVDGASLLYTYDAFSKNLLSFVVLDSNVQCIVPFPTCVVGISSESIYSIQYKNHGGSSENVYVKNGNSEKADSKFVERLGGRQKSGVSVDYSFNILYNDNSRLGMR